jgi:BioD-like phosphotransacetylase family protein
MRQVYLAATGMNRGKTTFALGLLAALLARGLSTAFTKPVGQRYALVDDIPADEDAILMRATFGLSDPFELMSPVHIPRGFTKAFIRGEVVEDLGARIDSAYRRLSVGREAVLIEGTGHAGVGAVVGLSNAHVAARLGAPAIIVSEAGVGRPIDEIVLNAALFARHGVPVAGAVVNKVDVAADPSLPEILRLGLARHGIDLLGVLPYRPLLSHPTLTMLIEQMHGELLHPGDDMDRVIEHVAIGAMHPRNVLERIGPGSLLILPGDRQDIISAAIAANRTQHALRRHPGRWDRLRHRSHFGRASSDPTAVSLAGLVFSGGIRPRERDLDAIREAGIFAYLLSHETYDVASEIHDLLVKTHPADTAKIEEIKRLVTDHFDVDALLERLDHEAEAARRRAMPASAAQPDPGLAETARSRPVRWLRSALDRWTAPP